MAGEVHYIKNADIDRAKWDACINESGNGTIYALSFYLDHMCTSWDALVLNDYEAVMPLPWRKKFGIFYLYQPFITAQLGLFGVKISAELLSLFLHSIPQKFRYWDLSLNQKNTFAIKGFDVFLRRNYVLDLHPAYADLFKNYKQTSRRNLKKSITANATITKNIEIEKVIDLNRKLATIRNEKVSETDYQNAAKLYHFLKQQNKAIIYSSLSKNSDLLAAAVFLLHQNKAYYILVGNTAEGKKYGAAHRIIDAFIQDHCGQNFVLDFEGSDVESLAFFYSSFGATEEKYSAVRRNNLPAIIKWLKK